jgi:hypothetical protein
MSTRKSLDAQHQGFFYALGRKSILSSVKRIKGHEALEAFLWLDVTFCIQVFIQPLDLQFLLTSEKQLLFYLPNP